METRAWGRATPRSKCSESRPGKRGSERERGHLRSHSTFSTSGKGLSQFHPPCVSEARREEAYRGHPMVHSAKGGYRCHHEEEGQLVLR